MKAQKCFPDARHSAVRKMLRSKLGPRLRKLLAGGIEESTAKKYDSTVRTLGGFAPKHFLAYLLKEMEKPERPADELKCVGRGKRRKYRIATQTMRGHKSACVHMSLLRGNTWKQSIAQLAERCLAAFEADNRKPTTRGALTEKQFGEFIEEALRVRREDLAHGAIIQWFCGLRPRDIRSMCQAAVVIEAGRVVQVRRLRKAPKPIKKRLGKSQLVQVSHQQTQQLLESYYQASRRRGDRSHDPFFPGYTARAVNEIFFNLKARSVWPSDVMFDGPHCFRHGMARAAYLQTMDKVREAGGWSDVSSPIRYSSGITGAGAAEKAFAKQEAERRALG